MVPPEVIKIVDREDWQTLHKLGADIVLDPAVVRTAHLFLLGRSRATKDANVVWKAIQENIGALATFVDALVLRERIPVFNYSTSWDLDPALRPPGMDIVSRPQPEELLAACQGVLTPFHYSLGQERTAEAYWKLVEQSRLQAREHGPVPAALAEQIAEQLKTYDFSWEPDEGLRNELAGVDESIRDDADPVRRYLTGCLIFSSFAQELGGDHVVPPGWSRLYAAVSLPLGAEEEAQQAEEALFARLAKAGNTNHLEIGRTVEFSQPTFFPYLLDRKDTKTPEALIRQAIALRQDADVQSYLEFRRKVRKEAKAGHPETYLREIDELVRAVERAVSKAPRRWPITMKLSVSLPGGPGVSGEGSKDLFPAYDWSMRQVPRNGYRKLLLRMVISQQQTSLLRDLVRDRWIAT